MNYYIHYLFSFVGTIIITIPLTFFHNWIANHIKIFKVTCDAGRWNRIPKSRGSEPRGGLRSEAVSGMCKSHMGNTCSMHTSLEQRCGVCPPLNHSQAPCSSPFILHTPLTTYAPWPPALTILNPPLSGGSTPPWMLQISAARSRGRRMAIRLSVQGDFVNWPSHFAPFQVKI